MRLWFLGGVLALIAVFSYLIWHETDNLALIEQTSEPTRITLFDTQSFVLPEPTKITNKDKTTTEIYTKEDVVNAYGKAKKDNAFYVAYEKGIYSELILSFGSVAFIFVIIGSLIGYWLREPIDGYDFKALRAKTEHEIGQAWEETRKAQETAQNAQIEALKQARTELENEKDQAAYQRQEAEKERKAAIKAQQEAEAAVRKAQIERTDALRVADNATRKKNAAYSAAERFKRRLEKAA